MIAKRTKDKNEHLRSIKVRAKFPGLKNLHFLDGFARLAPWAPPGPLWGATWATTSAEELPTSIFVGPPLQLSRFWVAKGAHFGPFWVAFRSAFARWSPNPVRVTLTGPSNGPSKTFIFSTFLQGCPPLPHPGHPLGANLAPRLGP